jgi:hypothetical protein
MDGEGDSISRRHFSMRGRKTSGPVSYEIIRTLLKLLEEGVPQDNSITVNQFARGVFTADVGIR